MTFNLNFITPRLYQNKWNWKATKQEHCSASGNGRIWLRASSITRLLWRQQERCPYGLSTPESGMWWRLWACQYQVMRSQFVQYVAEGTKVKVFNRYGDRYRLGLYWTVMFFFLFHYRNNRYIHSDVVRLLRYYKWNVQWYISYLVFVDIRYFLENIICLSQIKFLCCFSWLRCPKCSEAKGKNIAHQSEKEEAEILQARSGGYWRWLHRWTKWRDARTSCHRFHGERIH